MSEDRYLRINRNQLVSDTNLTKAGSLTTDIANSLDLSKLLSRVGDMNSNRKPSPGYCIRFDSSNVTSTTLNYIYTSIPSTKFNDYEYVIKGEGNIDYLRATINNYNDTICFTPKSYQTKYASNYFDLSYIACINKSTGVIEHLFECEEGNGLYLYDAITGEKAHISYGTNGSNVRATSATAIRSISTTKEWIKDVNCNLDNSLGIKNGVMLNYGKANLPSVPLSICSEVTFTNEIFDELNGSSNFQYVFYIQGNSTGGGYKNRLVFMLHREANSKSNIALRTMLYSDAGVVSYSQVLIEPTKLLGRHSYITIVRGLNDDKSLNCDIYIDGEKQTLTVMAKNATGDDVSGPSYAANTRNFNWFVDSGSSPVPTYTIYHRLDVFNFDMNMTESPMTVNEWCHIHQLPSKLLAAQFENSEYMFGATADDLWNITSGPLTSNIRKGNWRTFNDLRYCVLRTDDLPPNCKTGYALGLGTIHEIQYSGGQFSYTRDDLVHKWCKSGVVGNIKLKYRKDTSSAVNTIYGGLQFGFAYDPLLWVSEYFTPQGEWVEIDKVVTGYPWPGDLGNWGWCARDVSNSSTSTTAAWSISDFEFKVLTAVISLRNIDTVKNVWRDASANNNDAPLSLLSNNSYVIYPNKCYGTWLNGVGYGDGNTTDGSLTTPRKGSN